MKINEDLNKILSESQQLQQCLNLLHFSDVTAWRNNVGMAKYESNRGKRVVKFGHAGSSDILGYTNDGKFFAFEVKRYNKKPTQLQKQFLENLSQSSGVCGHGTVNDLVDLLQKNNLINDC
jgi:hypothetical protein